MVDAVGLRARGLAVPVKSGCGLFSLFLTAGPDALAQ